MTPFFYKNNSLFRNLNSPTQYPIVASTLLMHLPFMLSQL